MFRRFLAWNAERREWNRAHERAWARATEPAESGLSPFQLMCEPAVERALREVGITLLEREIIEVKGRFRKVGEHAIRSRLRGTPWTLWMYVNAAEVTSHDRTLVRLEDWDAKTPEELISTFVKKLREAVTSQGERSV